MKIKDDSRKIKKGDTFIAIDNGKKYIDEAIKNGAVKIINDELTKIETKIVNDSRQYLADYLKEKFKNKLNKITLIGITGTNGKTTTAYLIYKLFNSLNVKCAYIGTIGFYIDKKISDLNNTTPDLLTLYELFQKCINEKIEVIVMEVSSHALKLNRVLNIKFDYAIFTNLTQDHMDFHHNFTDYINSKKRLFNNLRKRKYAIINNDDEYYKNFVFDKNENITYGTHANYRILNYELKPNKSSFKLNYQNKIYEIKLNMPCLHNIYNYVAALIVLNKYGFKIENIIEKSEDLTIPPGRMELISKDNNYIFIDYAHTPDAIKNVLKNVKTFSHNKIVTIIGCGGNRDKLKRPIMGEIATDNSDFVIFTNDNPRNEDEKNIIKDITCHLNNKNYKIIYNRELAIKEGLSLLTNNDYLLILGKGHEKYQIINDKKVHFDDREIVFKYLNMKY